ncbi:YfiM family lipoprotein [Pectobacterium aroidearum]|uniref:YfiM family lipoprotein n=1 Tax=Pectobacterium aroidearum TaxID=1201031 RepID=UPI0015F77A16|nr:YfiM family lipoprotein [Pectobacterium aroidearum]MBA5603160.1 YfiM family lipoprotein [Pectobacterium aroidearum]
MRLLCVAAIMCCSGCSHIAQDRWTGQDKAQHFLASTAISAAGYEYGTHQRWSSDRSGGFGVLLSISLGMAKELYDSREGGTGWSWQDLVWDVAGATTGYALWQLSEH